MAVFAILLAMNVMLWVRKKLLAHLIGLGLRKQSLLPKVPIFETQKMALQVAKSKF